MGEAKHLPVGGHDPSGSRPIDWEPSANKAGTPPVMRAMHFPVGGHDPSGSRPTDWEPIKNSAL